MSARIAWPTVCILIGILTGGCSKPHPVKVEKEMNHQLPASSEIAKPPPDGESHSNRLRFEKSPYLLQHADNPVDWYPWGDAAFAKAKEENKPIFLSVGYSTCHWCHVMAHESFEDPAVAEILNRNFIPIKVDREERPEIDEIYMKATQLMTRSGGWPNSLFLTPEGKPFYAGTYFPPEDRFGRPGFTSVLNQLSSIWRDRRGEAEEQAERTWEAMERMSSAPVAPTDALPGREVVENALNAMTNSFDRDRGGFGGAPKFPPHGSLRLLLEEYRRDKDPELLEMATVTLDEMARGGIRDHLGGGFHRYSTDDRWFAPHFEKMLYDNAQLIRAYTDGYLLTGQEEFREAAIETCEWVLREMRDKGGGFYSALDADSEGEEGKFYIWERDEIIEVLGDEEGELFCRVYGVIPDGNWRDPTSASELKTNILFLPRPINEAYGTEGIKMDDLRDRLASSRKKLLARRGDRIRPHIDDKIMTDWNGLMIGSLAYAGKALNEPRYLEAAGNAASFILTNLRREGRLLHTYRNGSARIPGYLDDYANLSDGLLDLYQATGKKEWLNQARDLTDEMMKLFQDDKAGGFFFVSADGVEGDPAISLFRSKDPYDRAVPSGNGVAARVLLRLGEITGNKTYREEAGDLLRTFRAYLEDAPRGTESLILAAAIYLDQNPEVNEEENAESRDNQKLLAQASKKPVTVKVFDAQGESEGGQIQLTVRLLIDKGWHINSNHPIQDYLIPTRIGVGEETGWSLDQASYPEGERITLAFSTELLSVYEGAVDIPVTLTTKDVPPSPAGIRLQVSFQPCNDTSCVAPVTLIIPVPVLEVD
jgi:uncharacterized protein